MTDAVEEVPDILPVSDNLIVESTTVDIVGLSNLTSVAPEEVPISDPLPLVGIQEGDSIVKVESVLKTIIQNVDNAESVGSTVVKSEMAEDNDHLKAISTSGMDTIPSDSANGGNHFVQSVEIDIVPRIETNSAAPQIKMEEGSLSEESIIPSNGSAADLAHIASDGTQSVETAFVVKSEMFETQSDAIVDSEQQIVTAAVVDTQANVEDDDDDDDEDLFGDGDDDDEDDDNKNDPKTEMDDVQTEYITVNAPLLNENQSSYASIQLGEQTSLNNMPASYIVNTDSPVEKNENDTVITNSAIPRKSASGGSSPVTRKLTYTKAALTALGLPDGVNVPYSVDKERLLNNNPNNRKMMDTLRGLPVKLVNDALTEYDDAVQVKGNTIRNHGAYLYGVVKRYVAVHERAVAGGDGSGVLPMGEGLTVAVHARLEQLVSSGFCTREEMNDKVKSKIKMLPEKDALFALDELSSVSRSQIRNFGSYFMGILNRYMRGDDNKNNSSNNQYYPSSPQQKMGMNQQQRGRDRTPMYPNSSQPSYSSNNDRERSRDRFSGTDANRRFPPNPRDSNSTTMNPSGRSSYDTRQPLPPPLWQRQNPSQLPPQQQQTNMMGYTNPVGTVATGPRSNIRPPDQQRQGMVQNVPGATYPSVPQQQYNPLYQQQHQPSNPPNPYQPQQQSNPSTQYTLPQGYQLGQQQPPQQYQQQNAIMGGVQTYATNDGAAQSQYMPPQQQYQMNMSNQQNQASSFGHSSISQQGAVLQQAPRVGGWQPQQLGQTSTMLPVDIMGLADKAASAVQALSSANQMQNRSTNPSLMQTAYGAPTSQHQIYNPQSFQQPMYAQAGSSSLQTAQYPLGTMQGTQNLQAQSQTAPHQYQQSQGLQQDSSQSYGNRTTGNQVPNQDHNRRRTTASLGQLPHGVQYAIQTLIQTQAIEGPLDDGILGMIHDLPEALAIASLQKFATLDKNNMRNRTAYLAGVLRRELEKIQRR